MRKSERRFARWLRSLDEGWWDDAGDAHGILGSLQEAFEAGWAAGRKEPSARLRAVFSGHVVHNGATVPGELVVTIGAVYKHGTVSVVFDEEGQAALKQGLIRCGVL